MSKINALAGVIGQRETAVIAAVVDEITAKPRESMGLKFLPVKAYPQHLIYHEKVSGFGGLLAERMIGEEGAAGSASSSETFEFSGGAYQESIRFNEKDLITLRRLGSIGERGATGITAGALDFLGRGAENLKVKLENRLNKIAWDVIFNGKYQYMGVDKANFAVPAGNTIQAATDWSVPATAKPFTDLFNLIHTDPTYRKYIIKQFIINPVTAAAMLTSLEARDLIKNNANAVGDINKLAQILYPGLPEIVICKDAYQDQVVSAGGVITHNQAQFFVPDWKVLSVVDFGGYMYPEYGEIQMTYNLNDPSATIENPSTGVYTFVDEQGLLKRKAPYVEVVTGFNGGGNLMRSNDVLIIKTKVGI